MYFILDLLDALKDYGLPLGLLGAAIAFIFSVIKFWWDKTTTQRWKEFEVYHALVKELVEPPEGGSLFMDRQGAILYELRNFKRYHEYSLRMLTGLKEKWSVSAQQFPRLLDELNLTIEFLQKRNLEKCSPARCKLQ